MSVAAQAATRVIYTALTKEVCSRSNKCHSELVSESLTNIIPLPRGRVREKVKRY